MNLNQRNIANSKTGYKRQKILCSIGHGEDTHGIGDHIWIRSTFLTKSDIYYRMKTPAPEYARFHYGFLWLPNLAKHFVDYCQWAADRSLCLILAHTFLNGYKRGTAYHRVSSRGIKSTTMVICDKQWQLTSTFFGKRVLVLMETSANIGYGTSFWGKILYPLRSLTSQRR